MKKVYIFLLPIIAFFLASCIIRPVQILSIPTKSLQITEALPSPAMRSTQTERPSPTVSPSSTPMLIATVIPTPLVSGFDLIQKCIKAENRLVIDNLYGKLIKRCEKRACTLDFQNQEELAKTIITPTDLNTFFSRVAFSPDGRWFAYEDLILKEGSYEIQSRRLRIVSANGQEGPIARWEPDWRLYRWNDPETLILELDSDLDAEEKIWTGDEPHTLILFKPLTGETKELSLPALHNPYRGDLLLKGPQENYDPTFQRVAYLYGDPDSGYMHFSLWDIQADELLWKRRSGIEMLFGTNWSPDGWWLAVASKVEYLKAELFIVSRDGKERQVTDLKSVFPGMNITIGNFDWSPDGRFISLWFNVRESEYYGEWRFAILNVKNGQLVDYCFPGGPSDYPNSIWSPNSQLVAFPSYEGDNPNVYDLFVLDVEKNEANKISGGGWLWGWMVSPLE